MDKHVSSLRADPADSQQGEQRSGTEIVEYLKGLVVPRWAVQYRRPFSIYNIELTNNCPFKCVMCARTNNMTRKLGFMEFDVFKKAVDELIVTNPKFVKRKKTLWLHHFGESLEHPEFDKFIAYASEHGVRTGLSLNPLMLTKPVIHRLLKAEIGELLVSLDGHDNESFYKIRGVKNAFEKSKRNLLQFIELNEEGGGKVEIALHMISFSENDESHRQIGGFWNSLVGKGIKTFDYRKFTTFDGGAGDVNEWVGKKNTDESIYAKRKVTCRKPWWRVTIAWDGSVLPCCMDYNKKMILGNIKDQSLEEIWNGPKMKSLRREFLSGVVTNPLCKNCDAIKPL